jgi:hypothetical protein
MTVDTWQGRDPHEWILKQDMLVFKPFEAVVASGKHRARTCNTKALRDDSNSLEWLGIEKESSGGYGRRGKMEADLA